MWLHADIASQVIIGHGRAGCFIGFATRTSQTKGANNMDNMDEETFHETVFDELEHSIVLPPWRASLKLTN